MQVNMKKIKILFSLFLISFNLFAKSIEKAFKPDLYYTYLSFAKTLTVKKIYQIEKSEFDLYKKLFFNSLSPQTFLFETFISPLPVVAYYTKTHHKTIYDNFDAGENFNLLNILTAGEEDPWGISLFVGNIVPFLPPGKRHGYSGVAYSGFLFTIGNKHLKDNLLYDDDWFQFEWKIKGIKITRFNKKKWSFRMGLKFHDNKMISDTFYLSLFRDRIDYIKRKFGLWRNSTFDLYLGVRKNDLKPTKVLFLFGKNFPKVIKRKIVVYTVNAGILWEGANKYSDVLKEEKEMPSLQFILRPSIKF